MVLAQVPPDCSPVIKLNKSIAVTLLSQTVVLPSVPAFDGGITIKVAVQGASVGTPFLSDTITEYVPATLTVIAAVVAVNPPGPVQAKVYGAPPDPLIPDAVKVAVEPAHTVAVEGVTEHVGGRIIELLAIC